MATPILIIFKTVHVKYFCNHIQLSFTSLSIPHACILITTDFRTINIMSYMRFNIFSERNKLQVVLQF